MAGEIAIYDPREADASEISELRAANKELAAALRRANQETAQARSESARALSALRKQLSPLYLALQGVFGELDRAGVEDSAASPTTNPRTDAIWASWKSKFPGKPAMIIDALRLHREMNTSQIAIAIGSSRGNVPPMIFKLNKAGLLQKNGNMFSLKEL